MTSIHSQVEEAEHEAKLAAWETQNAEYLGERARLQAALDDVQSKLGDAQKQRQVAAADYEVVKLRYLEVERAFKIALSNEDSLIDSARALVDQLRQLHPI